MIALVKKYKVLADGYPWNLLMDERNKTMAFSHGDLLFVFNWHPSASIPDYELPVQAPGKYVPLLSTDESGVRRARAAGDGGRTLLVRRRKGRRTAAAPYPHLQHLAHGDGLPAKKVVTQRLYFPFYSPKQIYHISLKELREGFYQCRRFEATNLWRRSFLLSIFLVFCFAVYGALASEILTAGPGAANFLALNEAACAVALLGTSFA